MVLRGIMPVALLIAIVVVLLPLPGDTAYAQPRPTLSWGSRGAQVRVVQWRLSQWGYYRGSVDGVFGAATSSAVRLFQQRNGLRVDGVVGPATWRALGFGWVAPARPAAQPSTARAGQVDILARVVAAEARGEPYRGQVGVAAVMLNRLKSSQFPATLSGVLFQPHALESVTNGLVWRRTPTNTEKAAARDALNGFDPTYGSLFFWNPAKPVNRWIWTRRIIVRIGRHVFGR